MLRMIRESFSSGPAGIITLLIFVLTFVFAMSLHEWAHAYAAHKMGDDTARIMGRMTLNPLKHLDPIGTLSLLLIGIGYGKPVPVNPYNFRDRRKGEIITSLAGVTTNLVTALTAAILCRIVGDVFLKVVQPTSSNAGLMTFASYLEYTLLLFARISCSLAVFNLFPIPPLDGYHVVKELFLSKVDDNALRQFERIAPMIFMVLIITGAFSGIFNTIVGSLFKVVYWIIGLG